MSGGPERVAYFGIEATETSPILRCLKKWSPAKSIATPALTNISQNSSNTEENSADLALVEKWVLKSDYLLANISILEFKIKFNCTYVFKL